MSADTHSHDAPTQTVTADAQGHAGTMTRDLSQLHAASDNAARYQSAATPYYVYKRSDGVYLVLLPDGTVEWVAHAANATRWNAPEHVVSDYLFRAVTDHDRATIRKLCLLVCVETQPGDPAGEWRLLAHDEDVPADHIGDVQWVMAVDDSVGRRAFLDNTDDLTSVLAKAHVYPAPIANTDIHMHRLFWHRVVRVPSPFTVTERVVR